MCNEELKARLLGSFLLFTQTFYKLRTGREFEVYEGIARESYILTVSKTLTKVKTKEIQNLIINIPPRYGKTELVIHFIAWTMAHNPHSHFLYISYSNSLASLQTQTIREIMLMPQYRELFGIEISRDSNAKHNFKTEQGGSVYAAGSGGTITGRGAGIKNAFTFGGCIVVDDIHKPEEVSSDVMRNHVKDWWKNTLLSRLNAPDTPIIFIGQRLHEDDVASNLLNGYDGNHWDSLVLPALDEAKNPLCPKMHTKEKLLKMQETMPYEFAAQYQQTPQPAGGGLFKASWFPVLPLEPDIISTFITVDTAETAKTHNDATVFSLWGVYKITHEDIETNLYGIHWIDCHQCWVEPKDLYQEFLQFYREAARHPVKPSLSAIEKKSTGTTLVSMLKELPGMQILEIERSRASGSKVDRFLKMQPYVAQKQLSLPQHARHTEMCIEHMKKITANNTHRYDDIADTAADAVQLALIDKIFYIQDNYGKETDKVVEKMASYMNRYLPTGLPNGFSSNRFR